MINLSSSVSLLDEIFHHNDHAHLFLEHLDQALFKGATYDCLKNNDHLDLKKVICFSREQKIFNLEPLCQIGRGGDHWGISGSPCHGRRGLQAAEKGNIKKGIMCFGHLLLLCLLFT